MANRLGVETSPYLLKHADNQWTWYPWCEAAFAKGRGAHVHYAMHVAEDDHGAAVQRLRDQGYDPHEEDFDQNGRAMYVTDPDGNVVELWTWEG